MRREYIIGPCVLLLLVLVAALIWFPGLHRRHQQVVIASGVESGTYYRIARGLGDALAASPQQKLSLEVLPTKGSGENTRLVSDGTAGLGIVQGSLPESNVLRAIAPLYREYLHILVRRDSGIVSPWQLVGKRVALGEQDSGTRIIGELLLGHYGVSKSSFIDLHDDPQTAARKLVPEQGEAELDMLVLVAALHTPVVENLVATGKVRFLSLDTEGAAEGIATRFPYLQAGEIPAHAYPCTASEFPALPPTPVQTLSLTSLLVCHRDLDKDLVHRITGGLFQNRGALARIVPEAYQISEPARPYGLPYPLHIGAERYYRRGEPGFLVVYAEVIALIMSLMLAGGAAMGTLYRYSLRRRKNRIDYYYMQVARVLKRLDGVKPTREFLVNEEQRLATLRRTAYEELVSERLQANESFRIFQVQMNHCLNEVRLRKRKLRGENATG